MNDLNESGGSQRGQDLEGADFSGRDVRGVDFTEANLRSANFSDATLGVAPRVGVLLLGIGILISVGAGVAIGWSVDGLRHRISAGRWDEVAEGSSMAVILVVLVAVIIWKGFDLAFKVVVVVYFTLLVVNIVANFIWDEVDFVRMLRATAIVIFLVLAVTAGIFGRVIGGVFGSWSIAVVAVLGGLASGRFEGGLAGIVVAISLVTISKRAVRGDPRDRTLRKEAHRLIHRWGTSFRDADLTGANASLGDLRGATVVGVKWDPDLPPSLDVVSDDPPVQ
jgi:uncharacterized protein YjbI with pentapeptide repeats